CEYKGIKFNLMFDGNVPKSIYVNSSRLLKIVNALLDNAIKYTDQGSISLTVSSKKKSAHKKPIDLSVTIVDSGVGMSSEKLKHVFDYFAVQPGEASYVDSGLTLSITKKRIESLGGSVNVQSELGVGTIVTFNIPVREAETSTAIRVKNKTKALVVDDDPVSAWVTKGLVEMAGCVVDVAESAEELRTAITSNANYDVVFLGLHLPDNLADDQIQFIKKQNKKVKDVPVIIITAHTSDEDRERCLQAGADEMIYKPVLLQHIKEILADL
ncbi:MAG: response regulator, partial [Gammaproteobacteria bacterium]|nr:response regulator [Gammaproteobacteria bacterium]